MSLSHHLSNYTTGRPQYVIEVNPLSPMSDRDRISPLQYQYNINQMWDNNKEKYHFRDNKLIQS